MTESQKWKTYKYEEVFQDIEGDPDNVLLTFPPEVMEEAGWQEGDTLEFEATNGMLKIKNKDKPKDFSGNLITISVLEREIEYAKSRLRPHDTGHIHTAISWMEMRLRELKNVS